MVHQFRISILSFLIARIAKTTVTASGNRYIVAGISETLRVEIWRKNDITSIRAELMKPRTSVFPTC